MVTTTLTTPLAACAGAVTFNVVDDTTWRARPATPLNATLVAPLKLTPVTVRGVPPATGPEVGATAVTAGMSLIRKLLLATFQCVAR